ncbi:MAG: hypothetical protein R3E97_12840 [Candidatus Eisenbacteria bacterium]
MFQRLLSVCSRFPRFTARGHASALHRGQTSLRAAALRYVAALLSATLLSACGFSDDPRELSSPSTTAVQGGEETGPHARLLLPSLPGRFVVGPPRVHCRWDAFDQAGGLGTSAIRPTAFEYKLVETESISNNGIISALESGTNLLGSGGDDPTGWIRVPASIRDRSFDVGPDTPPLVAFGVRAVDDQGVPESVEPGTNAVALHVDDTPPQVELTITQPETGLEASFDRSTTTWEVSVPPEFDLQLDWQVDASGHGAPPGPTDYALDLVDPDLEDARSPNGIGGWIGWARRDGLDAPFRFSREEAGTEHMLYIRARDAFEAPENELRVTVRIHVLPIHLDRFALVVDDTKFVGPSDSAHDAYIDEFVATRLHELGPVDVYNVYGDPEGSSPRAIGIEQLGHYRVVLWHAAVGTAANSGLGRSQEALAQYLAGGGRIFFVGGRLSSLSLGDFFYPKAPLPEAGEGTFTLDSFVWRKLRYQDEVVGIPTNGTRRVKEASGIIGCRSLSAEFPTLELDPSKWDPWVEEDGYYRGGIADWEGVLKDSPAQEPPAGFEPMYAPDTFDHSLCCGDVTPLYEEAVMAHRYESPLPPGSVGYQGRTVVFNFQPWYFESEGVAEACRLAVDWIVDGLGSPRETNLSPTAVATNDRGLGLGRTER